MYLSTKSLKTWTSSWTGAGEPHQQHHANFSMMRVLRGSVPCLNNASHETCTRFSFLLQYVLQSPFFH